ncbi:type IV secretory system conjugative DNA transfer family protein [Nocardia takedensis]|uniref:type IV secretory system conjugative DNA transfer family protein n=1 Tax=Nocardia takedensis TaxID=259390 RepID=UPI001FE15322|nr:TraM recognition domain-containing protein [Nocardia takedensis]
MAEVAGLSVRVGGALFGGPDQDVPWNPAALGIGLMTGDVDWTHAATGGAVTLVVGAAGAVVGARWAWTAACGKCAQLRGCGRAGRIKKQKVDTQSRYMAYGRELADLRRDAVLGKAQDLNVRLGEDDVPGVFVGLNVRDGQELWASFEDLHLDIWGPRQGKSTSRVIPAVMEAPGAVVATSNKRDVVDATRDARAEFGRVWIFDPQGVAEQEPTWFWDPSAWVRAGGDLVIAERRAAELAGHFAVGGDASKTDAFFDPEGKDLLMALFLACAVSRAPITQAFDWTVTPDDTTPVKILTQAGFRRTARALSAQYSASPKEKSGVFSTAKKMAACLRYEGIRPWVTPPEPGEVPRTEFRCADFVTSTETLYPLSLEGEGTAGPLLTALCAAVADAATTEGTRHGGRLPVPMLIALDEAANIVKWSALPKQYSHFGSRGIIVMTILQSWAQGVGCWGHDGMTALWSAANFKVLGAGLDDAGFLRDRAELIGQHYELVDSVSKSNGHRSVSTSRTTEVTLTASDLASLPRGRAVVFSSGHRPALVQLVPWRERPYADKVDDSIKRHDPARKHAPSTAGVTPPPRLRSVPTGEEVVA